MKVFIFFLCSIEHKHDIHDIRCLKRILEFTNEDLSLVIGMGFLFCSFELEDPFKLSTSIWILLL